jgi:adenylate kinase
LPRGTAGSRVSRVVLLGAPGAGKGTQARQLAERLAVPQVASGELLRWEMEAGTPLGHGASDFIDRGELVPDELVLRVVLDRLGQPEAGHGFILDGFPRTLRQADMLDATLEVGGRPIQRVLELRVPTDQLLDRLAGRARLDHRSDDRADVVANRLRIYGDQTAPLVDYYRARGLLMPIDGVGTVEEVAERIARALEGPGPGDAKEMG